MTQMIEYNKNELSSKIDRMSYYELLKLEDEIQLEYEKLTYNFVRISPGQKKYFVSDRQQVKWLSGKIIIFIVFVLIMLFLFEIINQIFNNTKIMNSILIIFIYFFTAGLALFLADFIWQKLLTAFLRTVIRGFVHYWPATISVYFVYDIIFR